MGANPEQRGVKILFDQSFQENCMKMKKFWLGGATYSKDPPLLPPTAVIFSSWMKQYKTIIQLNYILLQVFWCHKSKNTSL